MRGRGLAAALTQRVRRCLHAVCSGGAQGGTARGGHGHGCNTGVHECSAASSCCCCCCSCYSCSCQVARPRVMGEAMARGRQWPCLAPESIGVFVRTYRAYISLCRLCMGFLTPSKQASQQASRFPPGLTHTRVQQQASSVKASARTGQHRDRARRQSRFRSLTPGAAAARVSHIAHAQSPPSPSSRAARRHTRRGPSVSCIASAAIALRPRPPLCCQLTVRLESPSHTNTLPNTAPPCLSVAAAPARRRRRRHPRPRLASSAMLSQS